MLFLCFEIRSLSCGMQKKANYFQKKKKKKKYFWCYYSTLPVVEESQVRAASLPRCYQNSAEKNRNEELLLDPKVRHWISLKKVSMCANSLVSPTFVPTTDAVLSFRD